MRILVTGGAGFIGSHLCEKLLKRGDEVFCFDNLITGKKANVSQLLGKAKFTFKNFDVINPVDKKDLSVKPDVIFDLASPAGPHPTAVLGYQQLPIETYLVNSVGTHNLCQLALETGAKFIFTSSSEVYGDPLQHPQKESYFGNVNPVGKRACYDESKRFGEMVVSVFNQKWGLSSLIFRIFNTYGPKMNPEDGRMLSLFIANALKNKDLEIFGDGEQTRSFCFIDDLVDGLIKSIPTVGNDLQVLNLGNPDERTVSQVADLVIKLTNSKSKKVYRPRLKDDPLKRKPDITKAKELLNWEPKTDLETGLKKTINYSSL